MSPLAQSTGRTGTDEEGARVQLGAALGEVEAPLCFAVGPEKSAVAHAQRRAGCVREESEGYLEPVVGNSCFLQEMSMLQAPRLSPLTPENLSLTDSFASDLTLG